MSNPSRRGFLPAKLLFILAGAMLSGVLIRQALALNPSDFQIDGRLHIVQSGENLNAIARELELNLSDIQDLNALAGESDLWIGQPLRIPGAAVSGATLEGVTGYHTVAKDESLHAVAVQYGLHPIELAHLNRMSPNAVLFVGQEIRVPSKQVWGRLLESGYMRSFPTHVVQASESLGAIAARFGVSEEALRSFNALTPTHLPQPGETLSIPGPEIAEPFQVDSLTPSSLGQLVRVKERWIEIDLGTQRAIAYQGMAPIREFSVSSGSAEAPTVTGLFRIWAKTESQDMSHGSPSTSDFEFLNDVPWVQYFYRDFAIHGAYWDVGGAAGSNGNVLLSEEDAEWLYHWTSPNGPQSGGYPAQAGWVLGNGPDTGTLVFIHP